MSRPYLLTRTSYLDFCPYHFPSQSDIFLSKVLSKFNYNVSACNYGIAMDIELENYFKKIRKFWKWSFHLVSSKPFLTNVRLILRQGHRLTDTENSKEVQKSVILQGNHYYKTRVHSSKMRTARPLTVVPVCMLVGGGVTFDPGQGRWLTSDPGQGGGWPLAGGRGEVVDLWPGGWRCCQPPPPPQILQNDRHLWKHNLRSLRYAGGNQD